MGWLCDSMWQKWFHIHMRIIFVGFFFCSSCLQVYHQDCSLWSIFSSHTKLFFPYVFIFVYFCPLTKSTCRSTLPVPKNLGFIADTIHTSKYWYQGLCGMSGWKMKQKYKLAGKATNVDANILMIPWDMILIIKEIVETIYCILTQCFSFTLGKHLLIKYWKLWIKHLPLVHLGSQTGKSWFSVKKRNILSTFTQHILLYLRGYPRDSFILLMKQKIYYEYLDN